MRVTLQTMALSSRMGLHASLGEVQDAQVQLSSGRRINRYADAPADAAASLRLRAREADWDVFARAAEDAIGWLGTQDNALQHANTLLQRARELVLDSANTLRTDAERQGAAREIEQIRDALVGVANTQYLGRAVFAGFGTQAVENVGGTWTYMGDGGVVKRRIEPDVTINVNQSGADLFGFSAGQDVFSLLDRVADDIRNGDAAALGGARLSELDARIRQVFDGLAIVGSDMNRAQAAQENQLVQVEALRAHRSVLEDVDLPGAVMQLQQAEQGYQAALAATARLSLPSLTNFLR